MISIKAMELVVITIQYKGYGAGGYYYQYKGYGAGGDYYGVLELVAL